MNSDYESSIYFDDDQLSVGVSSDFQRGYKGDQAPFKIGLNLLKEDGYSGYDTASDDEAQDELKLDPKSSEINMQENSGYFSEGQIYKINQIHDKLKLIVVYQNQLRQFRDKIFTCALSNTQIANDLQNLDSQTLKQALKKFSNIMQRNLEPITEARFCSIPESRRRVYLKKSDRQQILRKKVIKTLLCQNDRKFTHQKGLVKEQQLNKKFQESHAISQEIVQESVRLIEQQRVKKKIAEAIVNEQKQTEKELKRSVQKYVEEMERLHGDCLKIISQETKKKLQIVTSNNIKHIQANKKIRSQSESLFELIHPSDLFKIVPETGQSQPYTPNQFFLSSNSKIF